MTQQVLPDQNPGSGSADVATLRSNLAERLVAAARRQGSRDRFAFRVGTRRWTHGQVHAGAAATATLLARGGVGIGDRVLLAAPDGVEFAWAFLGAVRLGAIAVPVDPAATPGDHARAAADLAPAAVVCTRALAGRFPQTAEVLVTEELPGRLAGVPPRPAVPVTPETPAFALHTLGPDGQPMAALHRHRDAEALYQAFARRALALRPNDVVLSAAKLHTTYGLGNSLLFPLLSGACAVLHPGPAQPDEISALLHRHRPTILLATPTVHLQVAEVVQTGAPRSLRAAGSSGEQLAPAAAEQLRTVLGCPVLDGLAAAAAGHVVVSNTPGSWRDGTAGRPLPSFTVRVTTEHGELCAPGEQGVLWVRGPSVMLGYHQRPDATAAVLQDGWLRTGDLASQDPDGFVYVAGRADTLQNAGGRLVWPDEVEQLLCGHPGVAEAAVTAVRDPRGASLLRAAVVPAGGRTGTDRPELRGLPEELLARARAELAAHKVPAEVVLVETLGSAAVGASRPVGGEPTR